MELFFFFCCAKEKPHVQWSGWLDGWMDKGMRVMDNGGEIGETMEAASFYTFASFPSAAPTQKRKQAEANLRRVSITLLHKSPAGGGRCSWRRPHLHTSRAQKPTRVIWVCEGSTGISLGSDFRGKEMALLSKCVQKYLSDYCWNMNPCFFFCCFFFCLYIFSSDLKFCNIASSFILLIFHLLLVFHSF